MNIPKAILSLALVSPTLASSATNNASDWFGLWRAVDPLDGGVITLSISAGSSDDGSDHGVNLRFSDTFIRACTSVPTLLPDGWIGAGPPESKRGIYLAEANVSGDKLVSMGEGNDEVPVQIYCFSGGDDADKAPEGSPGVQANVDILWTFQHVGGSIVMSGTLFTGESALSPNAGGVTAGGDLTARFHRESAPKSGWTGMYSGVDPLDGGLITLSVSDHGDDHGVNLRFSDTFIRACTSVPGGLPEEWAGAGTPESKRGIYLADAKVDGSSLVGASGEESVPIQIYCYSGPDDDAQPGTEFDASITWTFTDDANGYFVMSGSLFNGENSLISFDGDVANGGDNAVRFHQIAGSGGATENAIASEEGTDVHDDHDSEGATEEGTDVDASAGEEGTTTEGDGQEDNTDLDSSEGSFRYLKAVTGLGSAAVALFSYW